MLPRDRVETASLCHNDSAEVGEGVLSISEYVPERRTLVVQIGGEDRAERGRPPAGLLPLEVAVGGAALALAAAVAALVLSGGVSQDPKGQATVLVLNILTLALAGLLWLRARPSRPLGRALLVTGLLVALSGLTGSAVPAVYVAGVLAGWAAAVAAAWLVLAFPGVRLDRAGAVIVGFLVATFLLVGLPEMLVTPSISGLPVVGRCGTACPANPVLVFDSPGLSNAFRITEIVWRTGWVVVVLAYLVVSFVSASRPRRRALAPVYCVAVAFVAIFGLRGLVADLIGGDSSIASWSYDLFLAGRILFPFGFVAALLLAQAYAGSALAAMARELGGGPSLTVVERLVRRVLDDPHARIAFWLPRLGEYSDYHGRRIALAAEDETRTWRAFGYKGETMFAIVHDPALSEDPELVEAVGAAAMIAIENRRLQQDLLASIDALRSSQRRLVLAGATERRKIERDLHDSTQQRLVAIRIQLELAREQSTTSNELRIRLAALGEQVEEALDELRLVAHGIYPRLLADEGLAAALREAARRASVPVELDLQEVGRLSEEQETAVYYCCLEAMQNVGKHAGDDVTASLRLRRDGRTLRFSIADDGRGFTVRRDHAGVGLTSMSDRIAAVGGEVTVRSKPGLGTTVEGRVALDAASRADGDGAHR
jgi:signal transduction histidine kinase